MARGNQSSQHTASEKIWYVAIYIRLSKEDGEDESFSVVNQRKIIMEYMEQRFTGEYVIVDFYIDDGATGTDYDRPHYQRMMDDVEAGRVNCIICKTLSRAFRNYSDQGYFIEDFFPRHETRFVSIGSPAFDSFLNPDAIHGLEVPITGLLNDRYAAKTSEDVRRTFNMKRRKGEFIGAFAPYGYAKDPENKNRLILDEEAAQIVREIFHWFVDEGLSKLGIVKRLNARGIPNPATYKRSKGLKYNNPHTQTDDGLWNEKTIRGILMNQMYLGHMVQGKQRIISYKVHHRVSTPSDKWFVKENTHEPIIDQDVFDKSLDLNQRNTRAPNEKGKVWLLSGFMQCADCGKSLYRKAAFGCVYYYCRTYEKMRDRCPKHSIREDVIQKAVLAAIQVQVKLVENLAEELDRIQEDPKNHQRSTHNHRLLASRKQEFEKLRKAAAGLYVDWKNDAISQEEYRHMKALFDRQMEQLKTAIAALESEQQQWENRQQVKENPLFTAFLNSRSVEQLDRSVLVALVDRILVHENKEITVIFQYADQYARLVEVLGKHNCNEATIG